MRTIGRNDRGAAVEDVQRRLRVMGYELAVDGEYLQRTCDAVGCFAVRGPSRQVTSSTSAPGRRSWTRAFHSVTACSTYACRISMVLTCARCKRFSRCLASSLASLTASLVRIPSVHYVISS